MKHNYVGKKLIPATISMFILFNVVFLLLVSVGSSFIMLDWGLFDYTDLTKAGAYVYTVSSLVFSLISTWVVYQYNQFQIARLYNERS